MGRIPARVQQTTKDQRELGMKLNVELESAWTKKKKKHPDRPVSLLCRHQKTGISRRAATGPEMKWPLRSLCIYRVFILLQKCKSEFDLRYANSQMPILKIRLV